MWRAAVLLLFLPGFVMGQTGSQICKWIGTSQREIYLDSLSILPSSITVSGDNGTVNYHYDLNTGRFTLNDTTSGQDSVEVCYQTIPYQFHKIYTRRSLIDYKEDQLFENTAIKPPKRVSYQREELFPTENFSKSGSLSRGISFGNTQNVVVNSTLNLQMEGALSDDLFIRASITDQNVPFQPEGNTAQIQDFDNIFIELYNDDFLLRAGDVLLKNKPSEFLRYNKNVQGGAFTVDYKLGEKAAAETSLGISVAKGKFASVEIQTEEGVSGPYRIRVPEASDYIIVLANSEKVFLDGRELKRGYNNDYVIDYNKAEIQFTGKVLITKFSRVRLDFEYSDKNYSRSIIAGSHYQQLGNGDIFFNYYSEKDNPNKPIIFSLSNEDIDLMQSIGDNLDLARRISAEETPYTEDLVLYERIDTLDADLNEHQVFRYSVNNQTTLFRVSFSNVGPGNGNYILETSSLNGRLYKWVSPEEGVPQGSYEPITKIPAPDQKDMITLGGSFKLNSWDQVYSELAFSKHDLNRFSKLDDEDDNGMAFKGGYKTTKRPVGFLNDWLLSGDAYFEYSDRYFAPVDRYHNIEYDRDWSYTPEGSPDQTEDNLFAANVRLEKDPDNRFGYNFFNRKRGSYIDGQQHKIALSKNIGPFFVDGDAFFMKNQTRDQLSDWKRLNFETFYKTRVLVPGYQYRMDRNEVLSADTIAGSAINFAEHSFYVRSNDTLKTSFRISHSIREDKSPVGGGMEVSNTSNTTRFMMSNVSNPNNQVDFLFTYRNNRNLQAPTEEKTEETINIRADWNLNVFQRHIRSDLSYSVGNSRELKKEYVFVQVATGEGTHTWRDDNNDGLQDLSEFYLAVNNDEKNYIKIFVPTDEYVFAYENNFNYRLNLEMPRAWAQSGGVKKILSRLSNISSWNNLKRITSKDLALRLLPINNNVPEEDILSLKSSVRSRFFYNRSNPGFAVDAGYFRSGNKQLLSQGFETRKREDFDANIRFNLSKFYALKFYVARGTSESASDFLEGRNYLIRGNKLQPELSWQPGTSTRVTFGYAYSGKINELAEGPERKAISGEYYTTVKLSKATSHTLSGMVRYVDINFEGPNNTPAAYEMLEALQPGKNITWNVMLQKMILPGLQLSLNYEGRKSADKDVVHIGRMQVSAMF